MLRAFIRLDYQKKIFLLYTCLFFYYINGPLFVTDTKKTNGCTPICGWVQCVFVFSFLFFPRVRCTIQCVMTIMLFYLQGSGLGLSLVFFFA